MHASPAARSAARRMTTWFEGADKLLLGAVGICVVALFWFLVNLIHPIGPYYLLWLPTPLGGPFVVAALVRATRRPALPPEARRFWRHLVVVACFAIVGQSLQALDVVRHPADLGDHFTTGMQIVDGIAVLVLVYALYRLPLGKQSRGEALRVVLDAGTVMLATGVFLWQFQPHESLSGLDDSGGYVALALIIFVLVAVFGLMKVALSGYESLPVPALRLLAVGLLVGALVPSSRPLLVSLRPHLYPASLTLPLVYLFATLACDPRHARPPDRRRGQPPKRRPFSLLPYLAVAAVDGLLLHVTVGVSAASGSLVVVLAAVVLTSLVVMRQITAFWDNDKLLERLDHSATHDALTQLPNRVLFNERLHGALAATGRRPVGVALIDLDDFKEVNDTLGHEVGDLLLKAVAERLARCVSEQDIVARLGGDEFVVVLEGADPAAAGRVAQRMIEALEPAIMAGDHELSVRASIGIADGRSGDEASLLLRQADIAMYAAKKIAGTAYLHHDLAMHPTGTDHAPLGAQLREAIADDQLFLLYQPIVSLEDGSLLALEALVRWAHPVRGTLAPDAFIPVAERTGLIVPLGHWVLDRALAQLAIWRSRHGPMALQSLNINVSARQLREADFVEQVSALLTRHGIPGDRITLEITESMAVELGDSITHLYALRAFGIRISLDDFGTGHSPLSLLHECPVDQIKLDGSFTRTLFDDRPPVAAAVIQLAQALGYQAVAEGLETREQARQLLALGYRAAQGYLFAPPLPATAIDPLIVPGTSGRRRPYARPTGGLATGGLATGGLATGGLATGARPDGAPSSTTRPGGTALRRW